MIAIKPKTVLFDVDGTLALRQNRDSFEWEKVAEDLPNFQVVEILRALSSASLSIIFISGRPDHVRSETEIWLDRNIGISGPLFMRASDDGRRDAIIKREIFEREIQPFHQVVAVFDDRDQVVEMWRNELGLTCFQVAYGNF